MNSEYSEYMYDGGDKITKTAKKSKKYSKNDETLDKKLMNYSRLDHSYKSEREKADYSSDEHDEDKPLKKNTLNTLQLYNKYSKLKDRNRQKLIDKEQLKIQSDKMESIRDKKDLASSFDIQQAEIEYEDLIVAEYRATKDDLTVSSR